MVGDGDIVAGCGPGCVAVSGVLMLGSIPLLGAADGVGEAHCAPLNVHGDHFGSGHTVRVQCVDIDAGVLGAIVGFSRKSGDGQAHDQGQSQDQGQDLFHWSFLLLILDF